MRSRDQSTLTATKKTETLEEPGESSVCLLRSLSLATMHPLRLPPLRDWRKRLRNFNSLNHFLKPMVNFIRCRKDEIDRIFRQIASFRPHKSCKIDEKLIKWCILRHIPLYLLTQGLDLQHLDHFSTSFRHAEHDEHGLDDWFWVKIGRFYD